MTKFLVVAAVGIIGSAMIGAVLIGYGVPFTLTTAAGAAGGLLLVILAAATYGFFVGRAVAEFDAGVAALLNPTHLEDR